MSKIEEDLRKLLGLIVFLSIFLSIYGTLHVYAYLKVRAVLSFGPTVRTLLIAYLAVMVLAPFIVRFSERMGLDAFARTLAYIGYIWMGFLLLFVSASFALDVYRFLLYLIAHIFDSDLSGIVMSPKHSLFIPLALGAVFTVYGYFEASQIRTEHVIIKTPKIPEMIDSIRIVQISDVHLGLTMRGDRLKRIIEKIQAADPDILVSTGDLVDGYVHRLEGLADILRGVRTRYGRYAVTGNHEQYAGLARSIDFTRKAGFTVLRDSHENVLGLINIVGVEDPPRHAEGYEKRLKLSEFLSNLPRGQFTILLRHRPLVEKDSIGLFDLQLSGHAHKGQIFPFSLMTWLLYPVHAGSLELLNGSRLYVSRGTGTWGPPIRFLAPPEITVIELVSDHKQ